MNTCHKAFKLLIARRVGGDEGQRVLADRDLNQHIAACPRCAHLWRGLREPLALTVGRKSSGKQGDDTSLQEGGPSERRLGIVNEASTATEAREGDFTLFVDSAEFRVTESHLTGAQVMDLAGISRDGGLILVEDDGTQIQIGPEEVVELRPGRRFKKAPRFVRG
jgi:hypothetical protein